MTNPPTSYTTSWDTTIGYDPVRSGSTLGLATHTAYAAPPAKAAAVGRKSKSEGTINNE